MNKISLEYIDESERGVRRWLAWSAESFAAIRAHPSVDFHSLGFLGDALCAAVAHGLRSLEGLNDAAAEAELRAAACRGCSWGVGRYAGLTRVYLRSFSDR
jgi:hypothetical protein